MKIALATLLAFSSPAFAGDYYYRVGHNESTTRTCYEEVVREEYIPAHQSHYGYGYINTYRDTVEVPCRFSSRPYRPSYPDYGPQTNPDHTGPDLNSCEEGSFLGAILGGGAAAAMSEKDAMGWSIPLGVVSGALIGCQVDGG